jgi:3'(2'), 5'-bisphosphate nucleotidase
LLSYLGFWTLDPIDGTQGFLRGEQYAVCLSLIENGEPQLGVLACPNFSTNSNDSSAEIGVLVYGVLGDKAYSRPLFSNNQMPKVCRMTIKDPSQAILCESYESSHSSHKQQSAISKLLGIETSSLRMDSQVKYAALARGDGDIYLRLPVNMKYEEKIWVGLP